MTGTTGGKFGRVVLEANPEFNAVLSDIEGQTLDLAQRVSMINRIETLHTFARVINRSSLNENFFTYSGSSTDRLALDDGTRKLPSLAGSTPPNELPQAPFDSKSAALVQQLNSSYTSVLSWTERSPGAYQFRGRHAFPNLSNARTDWLVSLANTSQDEPDLRFSSFYGIPRENGSTITFSAAIFSPRIRLATSESSKRTTCNGLLRHAKILSNGPCSAWTAAHRTSTQKAPLCSAWNWKFASSWISSANGSTSEILDN